MTLPAMWWWVNDWLGSPEHLHMSLEEQGALRNIYDHMWVGGGSLHVRDDTDDDEAVLARACGDASRWPYVRAAVTRALTLVDHGGETGKRWHSERLTAVLQSSEKRASKQRAYRERLADRQNRNVDGNVGGNTSGSPSPSPSPSKNEKKVSSGTRKTARPAPPARPEVVQVSLPGAVVAFDDWPRDWVKRLCELWAPHGAIAPGRLGAALSPLRQSAWSFAEVSAGLGRFLAADKGAYGPEAFARAAGSWVAGNGHDHGNGRAAANHDALLALAQGPGE